MTLYKRKNTLGFTTPSYLKTLFYTTLILIFIFLLTTAPAYGELIGITRFFTFLIAIPLFLLSAIVGGYFYLTGQKRKTLPVNILLTGAAALLFFPNVVFSINSHIGKQEQIVVNGTIRCLNAPSKKSKRSKKAQYSINLSPSNGGKTINLLVDSTSFKKYKTGIVIQNNGKEAH